MKKSGDYFFRAHIFYRLLFLLKEKRNSYKKLSVRFNYDIFFL